MIDRQPRLSPRNACRPRARGLPQAAGVLALLLPVLFSGQLWAQEGSSGTAQSAKPSSQHKGKSKGNATGGGKSQKEDAKPKAGALPFVPPLMTRLADGSVSLDTKGITLKGADPSDVTLRIGGKEQIDGSVADIRPGRLGPALANDFEQRRSWVEAYLTIHHDVEAAFQYDFADSKKPINDAVLAYRGFDSVILTIGNFKEPFSLDQLISDNHTLFVERSLLDAFAPARDFGAAVGTNGQQWTAVAGLYGGNANTGVGDGGVAATARVTYAPILTKDEVLHFGIAGSYRSLDGATSALSFNSLPENHQFATSLVNTGTIVGAGDVGRLGLEGLYQRGSARIKAEYALVDVGVAGGRPDRVFQSGYVEAAWVVNGDGRPYKLVPEYGSNYAVLGDVEVPSGQRLSNGGIGVFELGARFSAITLQDGPTRGGSEEDGTLGLNWYPDNNVKVMADYVRAHADPSAQSVTGRAVDSNAFLGRLQFYW